jgi:hypothetical protein
MLSEGALTQRETTTDGISDSDASQVVDGSEAARQQQDTEAQICYAATGDTW